MGNSIGAERSGRRINTQRNLWMQDLQEADNRAEEFQEGDEERDGMEWNAAEGFEDYDIAKEEVDFLA